MTDTPKITRIEVIDHRPNAPEIGRLSPESFSYSYQDNGRTLKIFIAGTPKTISKVQGDK
jgi:hypothetical protein